MRILDCLKKDDKWYDETYGIEFGEHQIQVSSPNDYNFEHSKSEWLGWKFNHILNQFNGIGSGEVIFDNDYVYKKPLSYEKYRNSSVLIYGGGPSTSKFLDDEYRNYNFPETEYNWSLNYFYKNSKLPKIDLAVFGKEVNKFDDVVLNYLKTNNTDIVFEEDKDDMSGELNLQKLFPQSTAFYKTRYASKIGIGVRMVIYAILLGVKDIYTIGLDGLVPSEKTEENHSFQGKKKYGGTWGMSYEEKCHLTKRQFIIYWEYIKKLQEEREFNITNLSENYTDISMFGRITKEWNKEI
tara:strand:+ start:262 stop:1149 length:888 start_codon:yes stop_codon:yes gene_type:complete